MRRQYLPAGAICLVVIIVSLTLAAFTPQNGDEFYHYPLARSFPGTFPVFTDQYTSAYTPLPYLLAGSWMKVAGTSLYSARAFNLIVGILGLLGMLALAKRLAPEHSLLPVVFLAFQPYYLRDCFIFYMGNYGLVAVIWALRFYLDRRTPRNTLLTAAMLGAATLCSQWALTVVAGVIAAEFVHTLGPGWRVARDRAREFFPRVLVVLACQIPTVAVFVGWGGLTHPSFAAHALQVSMPHVTGVLAVLGFVFAFWTLGKLRSIPPRVLVPVLLVSPLFLASLPEVSVYQGATRFTGLAARILAGVSTRLGFEAPVMLIPAAVLGLLALYALCRSPAPEADRLLAIRFGALLLVVAYGVSTILGETHVAFSLPLFFILAWRDRVAPVWTRLVVAQSSVLGLVYVIYFAFFKQA